MPMIPNINDLRIGISELDAEHLQMGATANLLYDAINSGNADAALEPLLDGLIKQTEKHFAHEENTMRRCGYPGYARHADLHRQLILAIYGYRARTQLRNVDRTSLASEMAEFVTSWLVDHITTLDRAFALYFAREGQKAGRQSRARAGTT